MSEFELNRKLDECLSPECKREVYAKNLCKQHYRRLKSGGDISLPIKKVTRLSGTPKERLLAKCEKLASGCWVFTGSKNKQGYGMISAYGRHVLAHRLSYSEFIGEIPDGNVVCHKCDNPSCVNPEHLFTGTQKDNVSDMFKKGRQANFSGSLSGKSKLTDKQVDLIREIRNGMSTMQISKLMGVHQTTIQRILSLRSYKCIAVLESNANK